MRVRLHGLRRVVLRGALAAALAPAADAAAQVLSVSPDELTRFTARNPVERVPAIPLWRKNWMSSSSSGSASSSKLSVSHHT